MLGSGFIYKVRIVVKLRGFVARNLALIAVTSILRSNASTPEGSQWYFFDWNAVVRKVLRLCNMR
jgi:hypothetical protein